ncbi:MAG: GNAT family N-acetyltransferase [Pseudomonadota bacterium]
MTVLSTKRLTLRPVAAADMDALMPFYLSERGRWHGAGPDAGPGRAWRICAILLGHWQIHGFGNFIGRTGAGQAVTSVGAFAPANWPERELGWSTLSDAAEGQGYTTEAAHAVIRHYRDDLGWDTLVSYIDPANTRSVTLAERLGATRDATAPRPDADDLVFRHFGAAA